MSIATVVIPVAPYHSALVERAKASAAAQTVPCLVEVVEDVGGRGAGWARNQAVQRVTTPFTVFLDADDELAPMFVEQTLRLWANCGGARYVYTDWRMSDGRARKAGEGHDFFASGMFHIITTLLPTAFIQAIGGFDESLTHGGEDEDFYARLHLAGVCHTHHAEPLVTYHVNDGRSATNADQNADYEAAAAAIQERFKQQFGRFRGMNMGKSCGKCGGNVPPQGYSLPNQPFEGSILVYALYAPMRIPGPKTGRGYPRAGLGQTIYVHKDDAAARPDLWKPVPTVEQLAPPVDDVLKLAGLV